VVEIVEMLRKGEKPPVRLLAGDFDYLYFSLGFFVSHMTSAIIAVNSISLMHFSMAHKTHNALSVDQKEAILLCMENQNLLHVGILMPAKAMVNVVSNNAKLGVFQAYLMICSCFIKLNHFFFVFSCLPGFWWMFKSMQLLISSCEMA